MLRSDAHSSNVFGVNFIKITLHGNLRNVEGDMYQRTKYPESCSLLNGIRDGEDHVEDSSPQEESCR